MLGFVISWIFWMLFLKDDVELLYKFFLCEMFTAVLINCFLNFYWSWLICKALERLIFKPEIEQDFGGEIEKKEDDLELSKEKGIEVK